MKQSRYIFLLIIPFILILNYSLKLYNAYFLKVPKVYNKVSQGLIEESLCKRGLYDVWKRQDVDLGYKDLCQYLMGKSDLILADRYEEALGKYNSYIVIWEGELNRIPKKGRLTGFDFTIAPGLHDIGDGTTWCYVDSGSADLLASNFTERQRVIVIARISGLSSLGTPMMTAYDVIPLEELKN